MSGIPEGHTEVTSGEQSTIVSDNKLWKCTPLLRFVWGGEVELGSTSHRDVVSVGKRMKILQQAWNNEGTNELEWRDVPLVEE